MICAFNNELYLAGFYSSIGGQSINGFTKWDGTLFQNAGLSIAFEGFDLETYNDGLSNECELWLGGEQVLGHLSCDPVSTTAADDNPSVRIFPNPLKDALNIHVEDSRKINKYSIYNSIGELILSSPNEFECKQCSLDVTKLISGIYFIKIEIPGEDSKVFKFVKEY